ncbi:MAG: response regulator, partial [Eubacteriales bacterium]|nr:response regulator [Eubacteriales bacterium]
ANLLKDHDHEPEKIDEFSDKIVESSKYLLGVINDILDVSAIENQKIVITRSPFDFRRQMESVATMFYGQCKEKSIDFKLNLSGFTEEYLFGDPMRLKEILINLVSNAIKFTPVGGTVSIRVSQLSRVTNMVKLRFEVSDNGEGIAENRLEAIFSPYAQETENTKQTHGGSGLGLTIVKNIVELMGGRVDVRSVKGEGSTFIVDLPFTISKEMPKVDSTHLKNVRALMIDDDEETQEYGKKVLTKLGIECDIVSNGEDALKAMKHAYESSRGYDICFVDWRMPGMSGIDITKAIRAIFDDDTVIVVASAYDLAAIGQEAKMAGANVVVPKPMFQSTVFDLLMNITGGKYHREDNGQQYNFSGKRVLMAEDNTLNAEVTTELLEFVGFAVDRVNDGQAACEKFEHSPTGAYAAILMDIQMPVMDGREATRRIRASSHPQAQSVPIIAVTANAFTSDVKASKDAGMNDHIAKPIDTQRLYAVLDRLVGQAKETEV